MKIRRAVFAILLAGVLAVFSVPITAQADSTTVRVTDTCQGIATTFIATVPTSVQQGKSFIVSGLQVTPSSSYGVTVTSSIFNMGASNASSSSYSQDFSRTNPSPTTGQSSYTAFYPNWGLIATGNVGSSISITLKSLHSQTQGFGSINCNLSQTLATIKITGFIPPPSPLPSPSPSRTPVPTPVPTHTTQVTTPSVKPSATPSKSPVSTPTPTPTPTTTPTPSPTPAAVAKAVTVVPLTVVVKDSNKQLVQGAVVKLDGQQKLTSDISGTVTFNNVLTGDHVLLASYKGLTKSQNISLSTANIGQVIIVSLPPQPIITYPLVITGIVIAATSALGAAAFFAINRIRYAQSRAPEALHGIIDKSAATPIVRTDANIPAIPVFAPQPVTAGPAPWDPPIAETGNTQLAPTKPDVEIPAVAAATAAAEKTADEQKQAVKPEPEPAPVAKAASEPAPEPKEQPQEVVPTPEPEPKTNAPAVEPKQPPVQEQPSVSQKSAEQSTPDNPSPKPEPAPETSQKPKQTTEPAPEQKPEAAPENASEAAPEVEPEQPATEHPAIEHHSKTPLSKPADTPGSHDVHNSKR